MNQPSMSGNEASLSSRAVPWPVWALLALAVVELAVQIAPDSYQVFGPYFLVDGTMLLRWLQSVTPFLLAAAVVLGSDRWPAGRRTLLIGAAMLAAVAVLRMGSDIWWALWDASGHAWDPASPWLLVASLATALLFVIAHALLAAGLWTTRSGPAGPARIAATAGIGLVGVLALGAAVWVVAQTVALVPSDDRVYPVAISALTAAGVVVLALLAVAAAGVGPPLGGMPESLIAAGAVIVMAAMTWTWSFPYIVPVQEVPEDAFVWVFTVPNASEVTGWVVMITGFALAALRVRRGTGERTA